MCMSEKSEFRISLTKHLPGQLNGDNLTRHKAIVSVNFLLLSMSNFVLNLFLIVDEDYRHGDYDTRPIGVPNILEKIRKSYKSLLNGLSRDFPSTVYESKLSMDGGALAYQLSVGLRKILQRLRDQKAEKLYVSSTVGNFTLVLQVVCSTTIWAS